MKTLFRKQRALILMLIVTFLLAACGGSDDNKDDNGVVLPEGVKKINIWVHVSQETEEGKIYKQRIDAFNKEYKDTYYASVSYIPRGSGASGYEEKIIASHTTGNLPDIITLDGPNTAAYAISEIIAPLDSYLTREERNDFIPSILQQGMYDGKLYSLGQMESTVGLYYNTAMFDQCGVEPATIDDPWTWSDLKNNANKLDNCIGNVEVLDMHLYDKTEWLTYALTPFLWTNEGSLVSRNGLSADGYFNSQENVESLNFIKGLYEDGFVFKESKNKPFQNGLVAMNFDGPWLVNELNKEYPNLRWGVMPYPKKDHNSVLYSPTGSWAFAMTSGADDKEGAAELVKWMTSTESTIAIHEATGMMPSRKSAFEQIDYYNDPNSPHYVLRRQLEDSGRARPSTPSYPVITGSFSNVIEGLTQEQDAKDMLDSKIAEIERDLRRFRK